MSEELTVSETANEDVETGTTPFTDENDREIAYRSDSTGAAGAGAGPRSTDTDDRERT